MRFTHKKRGAGGVWPIQKIVDRRDEPNGRRLYRIRWRFYDEKSDTWESIDALHTCLDVVQRYDEMRDQAEREGRWPPPPGSELSDHSPSTSRRSRPARSNSAMSSTPSRRGSVGGGASHSREQTPRDDASEDATDTNHPLPTKKQLAPDDAPPLDPHPPALTTPLADMEQGIKSARGGRWVKLKKSSEEPRLINTAKKDEHVKIDDPPAVSGEGKKEEAADAAEKTATNGLIAKVEDDEEQGANREKAAEQLPSEDPNEDTKQLDDIPAVSPDEGSPELSTEVEDKDNRAVNASVEEEATSKVEEAAPMEEEASPMEEEATPVEEESKPKVTTGHEPADAAEEAVEESVAAEAPPEERPPVSQSTTTSQPEKKKTKKKKSTPKKSTPQKAESSVESDKKLREGTGDDSSAGEPSSSAFAETPSTSAAPRQNESEAKKTEAEDKAQSSQELPPFAWDEYLKEAGAVPAPADAFYQPNDVPENLFEYDKFLLAPDDKSVYNPSQGCVAQVKGVHGPLVGIWLLGTDPRDVLWYMCDDQKLKPIVDLDAQKGQIVAPVMYRESLNNMHRKIAKAIFPSEGIDLRQPPESFRHIDSLRFRPRSNKFESGMKCEAFDPAEYTGFLYPCTIVVPEKEKDKEKEKSHDKKHVFIHFDGFSDGYNKKFSFDDRCIFPCGFASRAGLQIMPPASSSSNTQPKYKQHKTSANSQQKTTTVTPPSSQETELQPASSSSTSPPLASTSLRKTTQAMLEMASSSSAGYGDKFSVPFRGAKPASSASSSSSSADKLAQVSKEATTQKRRTAESSASVAQPSPPAKKAKPFTPVSTPAAHSSPLPSRSAADSLSNERSRGRQLNLSLQMSEGIVFEPHPNAPAELMTVYVHDTCTAGPFLNPKKLSKLPSQYGPAQHIHLYREIMQQIVNCAFNQFSVAKMIDRPLPDPSNQILNVTACIPDGSVEVRYLQFVFTPTQADRAIHRLLKKLSACENLFTMVPGNCRHCAHRVNDSLHPRFIRSSYATEPVVTNEEKCSLPRPNRVVSLSEVRELSYAQVCSFLISLGLPETYASQLFQEQVDGRALLRINDTRLISTAKLPNEALDFVRLMLDQAIP